MDLTTQPVRFGFASARGPLAVEVLPEASVPWRVAIHLDDRDQLHYSTGDETRDLKEDHRTLIFDAVQMSIPRIKDQELRLLLLKELWRAAAQVVGISERFLSLDPPPPVYVISPSSYSQSLLDQMRLASVSGQLRLGGFVHEAAALLVGTIQSGVFAELTRGLNLGAPTTISLIAAYEDSSVDVAFFDYSLAAEVTHRISIRDYFHTTVDNLGARLERCDWLDRSTKPLLLVSTDRDAHADETLAETLKPFSIDTAEIQRKCSELMDLKMIGATHVARCCGGTGNAGRYELDIIYNIGVQIAPDRFHPILTKDEMSALEAYPHTTAQVLEVQGDPGNQIRLDLYCGHSDSIADGILLDGFTLTRPDFVTSSSADVAPLALFATMKTPGSGEITLRLFSNDKYVDRVRFTLPALVA